MKPDISLGVTTKRILIVDDDVEMAQIMAHILQKHDYQIVLAHDGIQAIEKSKREKIDLILLDIRMPFFSGFWFCDAFKQREETKDIPVIVVSGLAEDDNRQKALDVGASAYLKKPFEADKLLDLVRTSFI